MCPHLNPRVMNIQWYWLMLHATAGQWSAIPFLCKIIKILETGQQLSVSLSITGGMWDEVIYCTVQGVRQIDFFQGETKTSITRGHSWCSVAFLAFLLKKPEPCSQTPPFIKASYTQTYVERINSVRRRELHTTSWASPGTNWKDDNCFLSYKKTEQIEGWSLSAIARKQWYKTFGDPGKTFSKLACEVLAP